MGNLREAIPIISDRTGGEGLALTRIVELDAATGANAIAATVGKDIDGNLRYLATNELGQLYVVTSPDILATFTDFGSVAGTPKVGVVYTPVLVAEIDLANDMVYKGLSWEASASRFTRFYVVHLDDATPTVLKSARVNGADMNHDCHDTDYEFTAGSTGLQKLQVWGELQETVATDLDASITTKELQVL